MSARIDFTGWPHQHKSREWFRDLTAYPLMYQHAILRALEQEIVERLEYNYGDKARELWEAASYPKSDSISRHVDGVYLDNYQGLAWVVCESEAKEIEALQKERAA
jgi:hypothetical protein